MYTHVCDWCDLRAVHRHVSRYLTINACRMHQPGALLILARLRNLAARAKQNPYALLNEADAIARGLRIMPPLPCCGWTYTRDTLINIGRGLVTHDDTPTHLCSKQRQYVTTPKAGA